ncbi:MAG: hypothetical protein JWO60_3028 [Frankiales bacterium]|nr:hypothetical protein [Frankiales bacterium]
MATFDDVRGLALALPEVQEHPSGTGALGWRVGSRPAFVWERRMRAGELRGLADPPTGPVLGARVADLEDKEGVLAQGMPGVFTIQHFDGYPAVLVRLDDVGLEDLRELVTDAWLARAPVRLRRAFLAAQDGG